jgi:hypothetical protein
VYALIVKEKGGVGGVGKSLGHGVNRNKRSYSALGGTHILSRNDQNPSPDNLLYRVPHVACRT